MATSPTMVLGLALLVLSVRMRFLTHLESRPQRRQGGLSPRSVSLVPVTLHRAPDSFPADAPCYGSTSIQALKRPRLLGRNSLGGNHPDQERRGLPTARAWLSAREAAAYSRLGNKQAAMQAVSRSEAAAEQARPGEEPWPWVFPFDDARIGMYRGDRHDPQTPEGSSPRTGAGHGRPGARSSTAKRVAQKERRGRS